MSKQPVAPTIRANVLAGIVLELRHLGAPVEALLRKYVGVNGLDDPYEQIPLARFVSFLEDAARAVGDPALGLKLGARQRPEEFGPVGQMFLASPNLRVAMGHFCDFFGVWQSGTRVELDTRNGLPEYLYKILDSSIWPRRQDAEYSLAATCVGIRAVLGPRWNPVAVHFEHDRCATHGREMDAVLVRVFRAPVLFGQGENRLILEPRDLTRPMAPRGAAMVPYLERHLRDLMNGDEVGCDSCAAQVEHIISRRMGRADLDVDSIAAELGLSPRTLQRRLAVEGTSFRDLIQRHRAQVANRLLKDRKTKMTAIAHDVGYADATTFSRAFKSWSGERPRDRRAARTQR
jgi:AraC-like DNA-binding protein